jgi:hypothetical protein
MLEFSGSLMAFKEMKAGVCYQSPTFILLVDNAIDAAKKA